jgi:hypothetical protein
MELSRQMRCQSHPLQRAIGDPHLRFGIFANHLIAAILTVGLKQLIFAPFSQLVLTAAAEAKRGAVHSPGTAKLLFTLP